MSHNPPNNSSKPFGLMFNHEKYFNKFNYSYLNWTSLKDLDASNVLLKNPISKILEFLDTCEGRVVYQFLLTTWLFECEEDKLKFILMLL